MAHYEWRKGFRPKVPADVFGNEVERIRNQKNSDFVTPDEIVEAARDPKSPIHGALQWDDRKAAKAYRVDQARKMLGALQVVRVRIDDGPNVSSRAMFRVRSEDEHGYAPRERIVGDRELRKQVVATARRELESYITKYGGIVAMGPFIPRLQEIIETMLDDAEQLEVAASRRRRRQYSEGAEDREPAMAAE